MGKDSPLVTVLVITYNSSEYVIETLESIRRQTYKNIELIVTDDCSKDNTPSICQEWLEKNGNRFVEASFHSTPHNMGVAGNINNGIKYAHGVWIRDIDGDDMLTDDSIESYVNFLSTRNADEYDILLAKCKRFGEEKILAATRDWFHYNFVNFTHKQLLYCILRSNFIPDSTALVKKEYYQKIGGYDENIPLLEDWPFWIKCIKDSASIGFVDKETVFYRIREDSLSNGGRSERYMQSEEKAKKYALDVQYKTNKLLWLHTISKNRMRSGNSLKSLFYKVLWLLNPMTHYMRYLTKKLVQ